ncbi:MAG: hypothetical protein ABEJ40_01470 [Haloarculaceae archaeon]
MLDGATPMRTALSAAANGTADAYTASVRADQFGDVLDGVDAGGDRTLTVGYEVRRGWASWASVTENRTTVRFHFLVHNPGDVPVPAAPDGVGVTVDMNDVRLFEGETDEFSLGSVDRDAVIEPGGTREVTFTVRMDNEKVDEWFTSHVRRDEVTAVSAGFRLVFEEPTSGRTFRLPADGPATYDCQFATTILVDEQPAETTCGNATASAG